MESGQWRVESGGGGGWVGGWEGEEEGGVVWCVCGERGGGGGGSPSDLPSNLIQFNVLLFYLMLSPFFPQLIWFNSLFYLIFHLICINLI